MNEDYKTAANRHCKDGELLHTNCRYDNAVYHFGFAVECGLKHLLQVNNKDVPQNHDLKTFLENCMLEPALALRLNQSNLPPRLCYGHPERRYWPDNFFKQADSQLLKAYTQFVLKQVRDYQLNTLSKKKSEGNINGTD